MRLFFGLELPDRLRTEVEQAQSLLRSAGADVRWVDPDRAHVTLKFLGEVEPAEIAAIATAAEKLDARRSAPRLALVGLGAFPPRGARLRVIWAGIEGELEPLGALHAELDVRLGAIGFARERRGFRPHVTLGRVRSERGGRTLRALLGEHARRPMGEWQPGRLVLFESRRLPLGARYEAVATWPLGR